MKFFDEVNITVKSWSGGDWLISGRREKHVPFGGPAGGNGGNGWSIYLQGTSNERTLMKYRYNLMYRAKPGEKGWNKEQYGKDAEDLTLMVPLWTLIRQTKTWRIVGQITKEWEQLLLVKWWKWWVGNMQFVTPQVQYPEMALHGEPGHTLDITLELQLLADVALVWMPSVGKSSLINAVSNVKAKTAEYHFTTLIPNVGVVGHKSKSFVLIDIPGLIEWASDGKGLGSEFLRHILKSRALCFMIDAQKFEQGRNDFDILYNELYTYVLDKYPWAKINLVHKEELVVMELTDDQWSTIFSKALYWIVNKIDMLWDDDIIQEYNEGWNSHLRESLKWLGLKAPWFDATSLSYPISAVTRIWVDNRLDSMIWVVDNQWLISTVDYEAVTIEQEHIDSVNNITDTTLDELLDKGYLPEENENKKKKVREVNRAQVSYLANVVPRWNEQAEMRFWRQLDQQGHLDRMQDAGVKKWDILKVISWYHGVQDKFIMRE